MALVACGGSAQPAATAAATHFSAALRFSRCMRAHGVPNFPDPTSGGGIRLDEGSGIEVGSPAFQAAQKACHGLLPGGGPGGGKPSAQARAHLFALARCMRAHGVSGFPDPVSSPPSSAAGYSLVFGQPGVFLAVPRTIDVRSPAFRHAQTACGFPSPR